MQTTCVCARTCALTHAVLEINISKLFYSLWVPQRESCLWVWCPTYPSCCLWHFGSWQPFVTLLGREIYNGARLSPSMTLITILRNYVTPIAKHSAFEEGPLSILFGSVLPRSPGWAHNISVSTFPWPGDYRHMATTLQGKWWFLNLYEMWFISRPVRMQILPEPSGCFV